MGQDDDVVFRQVYIRFDGVCLDLHRPSECAHCILGKVCFVTAVRLYQSSERERWI